MPITTTETQAKAYPAFGRVFRVEQLSKGGTYYAIGRGRGHKAMILDKIGCRPKREDMQRALDGWATRRGTNPITDRQEAG
jgi:hypothetical protein